MKRNPPFTVCRTRSPPHSPPSLRGRRRGARRALGPRPDSRGQPKAAMLRPHGLEVRNVDAEPALTVLDPGVYPGVAGRVAAVEAAQVTADVACRDSACAAAGDKHV